MFKRKKFAFLTEKDDRIKVMNDRINITEKYFIELCATFSSIGRKIARCRDKYDELAKTLKLYSEEEPINESLCEGLKSFSNATTFLADYMDLEVHRIEMRIVNELSQYENIAKNTRESLRSAVVLRDKEVFRQKQLIEIKNKFAANTSAADSELLKAKLEVNRTNKEIDDIIDKFEKKKLEDIKSVLLSFILIQIKEHSKAIEVLTAAYYDISSVDEEKDFLDFKKLLKGKDLPLRHNLRASQSMDSLGMGELNRQARLSRSTKDLSRRGASEDELEEEDDEPTEEEDDDDEEESEEENASRNRKPRKEDSDVEAEAAASKSMSSKVSYSMFKQKAHPNLVGVPRKGGSASPVQSPTFGRLVTVESMNGASRKHKKIIDCTKSKN